MCRHVPAVQYSVAQQVCTARSWLWENYIMEKQDRKTILHSCDYFKSQKHTRTQNPTRTRTTGRTCLNYFSSYNPKTKESKFPRGLTHLTYLQLSPIRKSSSELQNFNFFVFGSYDSKNKGDFIKKNCTE